MESKRPCPSPTPPPPAASHSESKVLGDDNLLREIIVRLAFPTNLVRAALVCKRWLGHASDPAFLRRFRKLHPPRLLGFYVAIRYAHPRFVQMLPQPPELAAVCRRASFDLDSSIWGCWNGSVVIISSGPQGGRGLASPVYSPLCPTRSMPVVPELLPLVDKTSHDNRYTCEKLLFREAGDDDNGLPYLWLLMECIGHQGQGYTVHVFMLQHGVWSKHTSATTEFPYLPSEPKHLLIDNKIYMTAASSSQSIFQPAILSAILVLDLKDSSFLTIQLPGGVKFLDTQVMLAKADDDTGVYLIHLTDLKLCIWLHSSRTSNWSLVDTICLREMFAALRTADHTVGGEHTLLWMKELGDNAEFIFFQMGRSILYLDIKRRELRKVYDMTEDHQMLDHIYPFMMVWPPTFPAPKDDLARNAS